MKLLFCKNLLIAISLITTFINSSAQSIDTTISASGPVSSNPANGDWQKGEQLFVGNVRLANDGPACSSCHNVTINGFSSGGALAKDLTQAVTRLTPDGAKAFFASSPMPMPQMQNSYTGKPLTTQEKNDLLAFLVRADELAKATQPESKIGTKMLTGGIAGVVGIIILFSFFWIKRKKRTVNYSIYERQIKSAD